MTTETVTLTIDDKPGTLGNVTRCLADNGINITGFCADRGNVFFNTDNNDNAFNALTDNGFDVNKTTTFMVELPNEPGRLATLTENLGNAGVNIITTFGIVTGTTGTIMTVVDNPEAAAPVFEKFGTTTVQT